MLAGVVAMAVGAGCANDHVVSTAASGGSTSTVPAVTSTDSDVTELCSVLAGMTETGPGDDPTAILAVLEDARAVVPPELESDLAVLIEGFRDLDQYSGDAYWEARYRLSDDPEFVAAGQALEDHIDATCDPSLFVTTTVAPAGPDDRFRPLEPGEGIDGG